MEKQLSPTQLLSTQIKTQIGEKISQLWTGQGDPEIFVVKAVNHIITSDKIKNCTKPSLYLAILDAARAGMNLDGVEGAIVPYGKTATFQPMYPGLAKRSGWKHYKAFVVRENDYFKYTDSNDGCSYEFSKARKDRGEFELAVCWSIDKDNFESMTVVSSDVMLQIENKAKQRNPVWRSNREAMWQKTAAKQHAKYQVFEDMSVIKAINDDDINEFGQQEKEINPTMTKAEQTALEAAKEMESEA